MLGAWEVGEQRRSAAMPGNLGYCGVEQMWGRTGRRRGAEAERTEERCFGSGVALQRRMPHGLGHRCVPHPTCPAACLPTSVPFLFYMAHYASGAGIAAHM